MSHVPNTDARPPLMQSKVYVRISTALSALLAGCNRNDNLSNLEDSVQNQSCENQPCLWKVCKTCRMLPKVKG